MFVEALVLTMCLQNQGGCTESTSAYVHYNKDVQTTLNNVEKFGNRLVMGHEWIVYAASPFLAAAAGKPANFKLSKNWVLAVNVKQENMYLQWSY